MRRHHNTENLFLKYEEEREDEDTIEWREYFKESAEDSRVDDGIGRSK